MADHPSWPALSGPEWQQRVRAADAIGKQWAMPPPGPEADAQAESWMSGINPTAYVGSRHHTVPRFMLERWADRNGRVRVFHRVEGRRGIENVRDLAIKDFYTIVDKGGAKNSTLESLVGVVENAAQPHIEAILSPFSQSPTLGPEAIFDLAQFAAFQSTRTARHRREIELHAEWYGKTMASGRISDEELRKVSIAPHQNELIEFSTAAAQQLMPFFLCRPLAVIHLGAQLLYMCDEPVVVNSPAGEFHVEDCFLTDAEIEARIARQMRKVKAKRRGRRGDVGGRVVHFSSTRPTGHGVADEILLPISPGTALLWGPLRDGPQDFPVERVQLSAEEAVRFAGMANEAMCSQALDWILSRLGDEAFVTREFPPIGPLMRVCDGTNAAAAAVNEIPSRFRPRRLWMPED